MPHLTPQLAAFIRPPVCVLGFGNRLWRDDGAGSHLAETLGDCPGVTAVDGGAVPENHLEQVVRAGPGCVLLVDAADFGGRPGEARLLEPSALARAGLSTHAGSAHMLARYLAARTGAPVAVLAIQPADCSAGDGLSPPVAEAVAALVAYFSDLQARAMRSMR